MAPNLPICGIPPVPVGMNARQPNIPELYRTLKVCLKYVEDGCNAFSHVICSLDEINFIFLLRDNRLSEPELARLLPMLGQRLKHLRIQLDDIGILANICRAFRVRCLAGVEKCTILPGREERNRSAIVMLGRLVPYVKTLFVGATINSHFPILRHLEAVYVEKIGQVGLDDLFSNSPALVKFTMKQGYPDINTIRRSRRLMKVILPLQLRSPLTIHHLKNLTDISMVRPSMWPGMDWLPTVLAVIHAKRYQLTRLTFDGSWLVCPLDFSRLRLLNCTALVEVRFSNCMLKDVIVPALPLCCKTIILRGCTVRRLNSLLKFNPLVRDLQIINTQVQWNVPVLKRLLTMRKYQPSKEPLKVTFCQSAKLRSEYKKWKKEDLVEAKPFLQVKEIQPYQVQPWENEIGMISMTFGMPVNYVPEIPILVEGDPTAAEIVRDLNFES
ncbi:uncharacterized protein [Drosophila bipectinata]|uniref:uncharacterized protein n=1 Tax=Drosophila bipectinata TaxID=42026 RepID=UPI001C8ABD21|nr:uncharacterized protein LOC108121625 [Drosophila bipectinata]